jgi:hypothetical protein
LFPIPRALNERNAAAREDSLMRSFRRTAAGLTVLGLLFTTGCQGSSNGEAEPLPPAETSSSPSETPTSSSPSPTEPAWQDDYSQKEIAAYEAALKRFETYEQRSEPIWRRGKATPGAEKLFKEYFEEGLWQRELSRLRGYEQAQVEVHGNPTVLRSRATRIALNDKGASVSIRQCIDYSTSQLLQNGEQAPGAPKSPRVRRINLTHTTGQEGTPWLISGIYTYEGKRRCSAG